MPDREKVIYGLCKTLGLIHGYLPRKLWGDGEKACRNAIELLKEQGWNVLTEDADGIIHGLPGDDGQYLMTDGEDIWIDEYVDGVADGIFLDSGRDIRDITAWMYMPKLPKKDRR